MKKANVHLVRRWDWICPECGYIHEECEDPKEKGKLVCEDCEKEFEPTLA